MGSGMVKNLAEKGYDVTIFDLSPAAIEAVQATSPNVKVASTPALAAVKADAVITMLPGPAVVQDVYLGAEGLVSHPQCNPGAVMIDSSTIDPATAQQVDEQAAAAGLFFTDAPVSGGVAGASNGTLTFMVGGSKPSFEAATPMFEAMGTNIFHCGDTGTGQTAKLCNNLALGVSMCGIAEAMELGARLGMDPDVLTQVINKSTAGCWSSSVGNPYPGVNPDNAASKGYNGGFGVDLMLKDISLAIGAARGLGQATPTAATAQQLYQILSANGMGGKDFGSVITLLQGKFEKK